MLHLTVNERKILICIGVIILFGAGLRYFNVNTPVSVREEVLINVNQVSARELEALPGIGPAIAQRIISYRGQNGSFADLESLRQVNGIGDSKIEAIKNLIVFGDSEESNIFEPQ